MVNPTQGITIASSLVLLLLSLQSSLSPPHTTAPVYIPFRITWGSLIKPNSDPLPLLLKLLLWIPLWLTGPCKIKPCYLSGLILLLPSLPFPTSLATLTFMLSKNVRRKKKVGTVLLQGLYTDCSFIWNVLSPGIHLVSSLMSLKSLLTFYLFRGSFSDQLILKYNNLPQSLAFPISFTLIYFFL